MIFRITTKEEQPRARTLEIKQATKNDEYTEHRTKQLYFLVAQQTQAQSIKIGQENDTQEHKT